MPDFTLEPDEIEPDRPERGRPVRLVSTGLAPTADVPQTRVKDAVPVYAPCEVCGQPVLLGMTRTGTSLALDVGQATYTVVWPNGTPRPLMEASRAYPVHRCAGAVL